MVGYQMREFFLDGARENITRVLRNNRRTKVKLIFKFNIERPSKKRGNGNKTSRFSFQHRG